MNITVCMHVCAMIIISFKFQHPSGEENEIILRKYYARKIRTISTRYNESQRHYKTNTIINNYKRQAFNEMTEKDHSRFKIQKSIFNILIKQWDKINKIK